ncbi:MAG: SpoIIIAH-like family protein [Peptococcales bacterium]|jgi:stage III sporulation protein AH
MIILLRLRNLAIFALAVLSVSFIYIGYNGFGNDGKYQEAINLTEEPFEWIESAESENIIDIEYQENVEVIIDTDSLDSSENFFAEFRMKRDRARALQIELLQDNVNNPRSTQETINNNQEMLSTIAQNVALEAHAENLLQAKDYINSAVFIEGENVSVFVQKDNLSQEDVTIIGDLIVRATGCKLEQVVITPRN